VRLVGILLIVGGTAIAGFVGYELWVTGAIAQRGQEDLAEALSTRVAAVALQARAFDVSSLTESPIALPPEIQLAGVPQQSSEGSDRVPPGQAPEALPEPAATGTAPVDLLPGEELDAPIDGAIWVMTEAVPPGGEALGRIRIPSAGVDWTVVEGVARANLRSGAGHMPGTALPGEPGNAVVSGHRTTYGAPFAHLDRLVPGDEITVETATGAHTYAVVETRVVRSTETWVTGQWRGAWLTLTTCHPRYSAAERLVVFAHLVAGPNAGVILASS
jgi:sortase A